MPHSFQRSSFKKINKYTKWDGSCKLKKINKAVLSSSHYYMPIGAAGAEEQEGHINKKKSHEFRESQGKKKCILKLEPNIKVNIDSSVEK